MQSNGDLANLFSNCINTKNLKLGRSLHSHLIKTAFILDTFFTNRLIQIYSRCNSIDDAQKTFDDLTSKNAHSWNTMISAYSVMGRFERSRHLLDEMPEPNLVTYNSVISSFCRSGIHKEAVNLFKGMQKTSRNAVLMDEFTVVGLANACANLAALELLRQVHGASIIMGLEFNRVVYNALIDAYGKCGVPKSSYSIFSQMVEKDVVSWTALIMGLAQNGEGERALYFFTKMQDEGIIANDVTYVSALSACADLALVEKGKQIQCFIVRNRSSSLFDNVFIVNALIDMYSKCGEMISSTRLFTGLHEKDIVTWNSLITGFAQNGQGEASLAVFEMMVQENVRPNHVTFVGVLSACSHSGLVSEGLRFLATMEKRYNLIPRSDHYAIIVDLLGRKNRLGEALEVIEKANYGSSLIGMWGSLLANARVYGNLEFAKRAADTLFELEPKNTGRYVMLSNIYANAGMWDDAREIRRVMEEMELTKEAGSSWIEVKNVRHVFVAEDMSEHKLEDDIRGLLANLVAQMKDVV